MIRVLLGFEFVEFIWIRSWYEWIYLIFLIILISYLYFLS
jgi:hypothetical protein